MDPVQVGSARRRFLRYGRPGTGRGPPEVLASWERSRTGDDGLGDLLDAVRLTPGLRHGDGGVPYRDTQLCRGSLPSVCRHVTRPIGGST